MGKYSNIIQNSEKKEKKFIFRFISGKYSGGEFMLKEDSKIIIGRDISADVAIIESKVSRKHACLSNAGADVFLEDLDSTNGTVLNGNNVKPKEKITLKVGDELVFGESLIKFIGDSSQPPKPEKKAEPEKKPEPKKAAPAPDLESIILDDDFEEDSKNDKDSAKLSIGKVNLQKQMDARAAIAKTRIDSSVHSTEGKLSKVDPLELIKMVSHSSSIGFLKVTLTKPFSDKIEIRIGTKGLSTCTSLNNKKFAPEKILTRLLLSKEGDYFFKESEEPRSDKPNNFLDDIVMEIGQQKDTLLKYRKIIGSNQLRFSIPMTGKLSDLKKNELDTLQFMINAQEVIVYLNMFQEQDDFMLLSEILKYIELGILFGDNGDDAANVLPDDILDL